MRYILVLIAIVLMLGAVSTPARAQLSISLGFNVERQPIWGPTGYDHVDFYYFPDIDVYYNVPQHRYFYFERNSWRSGSNLPRRYRGFNPYSSYKVVVNDPTPYRNAQMYRDKYASYKGRHDQESIRDSRDSKYYVNPNHPQHKSWVKQNKENQKNGRRNGNNQGNQNSRGNGNDQGNQNGQGNNNGQDNHNGNGYDRNNDPGRK
jgi:hypothetical protein